MYMKKKYERSDVFYQKHKSQGNVSLNLKQFWVDYCEKLLSIVSLDEITFKMSVSLNKSKFTPNPCSSSSVAKFTSWIFFVLLKPFNSYVSYETYLLNLTGICLLKLC